MSRIIDRRRVMGGAEHSIPNNAIVYQATEKLPETTSVYANGVLITGFNANIISHTYSDGIGTIIFDDDVTELKFSAFRVSTGLTGITLPDSVLTIGESAFYGCSNLTSLIIPSNVTTLGVRVCIKCTSLSSVILSSKITEIPDEAFDGCPIQNLIIPEGITRIGKRGLVSIYGSITFPSSLSYIDEAAFSGNNRFTTIISKSKIAPQIASTAFQWIASRGTLYVPIGSTGYEEWMRTDAYYLGYYNWTKVEQQM